MRCARRCLRTRATNCGRSSTRRAARTPPRCGARAAARRRSCCIGSERERGREKSRWLCRTLGTHVTWHTLSQARSIIPRARRRHCGRRRALSSALCAWPGAFALRNRRERSLRRRWRAAADDVGSGKRRRFCSHPVWRSTYMSSKTTTATARRRRAAATAPARRRRRRRAGMPRSQIRGSSAGGDAASTDARAASRVPRS